MISKSTIKLIKSLAIKKYRQKEKKFLVEGDKNVLEILSSDYRVSFLYATKYFIQENQKKFKHIEKVVETLPEDIKKASLLISPQNCLAVCELPNEQKFPKKINDKLSLFLDGIQDPGNLGTIIRICDWFGIHHIFYSADTVNFFSPKVIQASMGSFCRVQVWESTFEQISKLAHDSDIPIYGTFLNGKNIYTENLPTAAIIVIGNEGNGIRENVEKKIINRITIPKFMPGPNSTESLNVGIATGIVCAEFRRQNTP